jgi:hypothetical protein
MAKKKIEDKIEDVFINDPNLQNNWIDRITISARTDGICMLRCYTNLPEGNVEKTRLFLTRDHLKNIVGAIESVLNLPLDVDNK